MRYLRLMLVVLVWPLIAQQAAADHHSGVFGAWDLTVQSRRGTRPSWVKLFKEQETPVVEFVGATGGKNRAEMVQATEDAFRWKVGDTVYEATLANGQLTGNVTRGDRRASFTGQRVVREVNLTGIWNVQLEIGDRSMDRVLQLEQRGAEITGTYRGAELPERKLTKAELKQDQLTYSIDFETDDGQQFQVDYVATVRGDRFAGTFEVVDTDFEGAVTATRRREWAEPIELFNGSDLSNWDFQRSGATNQWAVVDAVMVNKDAGWNIFTKQKFEDYKLRLDVRVPPRGNSGIYINGRYEVQVEDSYGKDPSPGSMGAIYGRAIPTANPSKSPDEWQTFEITFVDYWVTVKLNGTTVVENVLIEGITGGALDSRESEPGPIMLQGDHGHIEYRNIVLTPLKSE